MSIVEKAVGALNDRSGTKNRDDGAPPRTPAVEARPDSGSQDSSDVVCTQGIHTRGLLSVSDDPAMNREFRFLKRPLLSKIFRQQGDKDARGHIVLITSDMPGSGKSFVAFNLAASIAQEQLTNVLLIDGDPLRRNLSTILSTEDCPGLIELLLEKDRPADSVVLKTDRPGLRFMPAGQPHANSTELFAGKRMRSLLRSLQDPDTVVLLDSPPVLLTAEARVLADRVDYTLIVVEAGRTTIGDVEAIIKMLGSSQSSMQLILNKSPSPGGGRAASYYGYEYGQPE